MGCIRFFSVRVMLVILLVGLQACAPGASSGSGGGSQGNGSGSNTGNAARDLYASQCAGCHGTSGQGVKDKGGNLQTCDTCTDTHTLSLEIETTMPPWNAAQCDEDCADQLASYIMSEFVPSQSSGGNDGGEQPVDNGSNDGGEQPVDNGSNDGGGQPADNGSNAGVIYSETFENAELDTQPSGWDNFLSYNYNTSNSVTNETYALVDDTYAYNGSHSIHFKGSLAQIVRSLPANTERVHLRAYVRMSQQMGNVEGDNHEHIMGIKSTQDANNEVRVGQIKGVLGTNEVPSDNIAPTSAQWESGTAMEADTWYCVETAMYADTDYDELHLWVDGQEVHSITSDSDWNNGAMGSDWLSDKFNYVMFGFHSFSGNTADVWMDDIVVSSEPIGCGAIDNGTSGDSDSASGDATHGETLYADQCDGCHGANGEGTQQGTGRINATRTTYGSNQQTLADYIRDTMPPLNTGACDADCAADIAAYIESWTTDSGDDSGSGDDSDSGDDSGSTASCGVTYGPRSLRLLTQNEFANSVEDLTGVNVLDDLGQSTFDTIPADNMLNGYSNNTMAAVSIGSLQAYGQIIDKVVDHLLDNGLSSVINCDDFADNAACSASFIENNLPLVFRRPLIEAEVTAYQSMFTSDYTGGDINEGLALALRTALTSPQFLYRDETGVAVADLNSGSGDSDYEASGTVQTFIDSSNIRTISMYNQYGTNANFTGNDLVTIRAKGVQGSPSGNWPTLDLKDSGGNVLATALLDHSEDRTYSFHLTSLTGTNWVSIANNGNVNNDDYRDAQSGGSGHELVISQFELSEAQEAQGPALPEVTLDSDAYVLTPYQLASYLAFTFTGSTPDQTLMQAAAEGLLETDAQISAQVERLLETSRAREHFGNFAAQWLRTDPVLSIGKSDSKYPTFTNEVREAMAQEVREVFNHVVLDEGEAFTSLYDGDFTFVNQALAEFYGISGVTGSDMRKVSGLTSRAGMVTNGAFLATHAHEEETAPIIRATYMRRRFLCHNVPIPPTGVSLTDDGDVDFDEERESARQAWLAYLEAHNGQATARRKYEYQTSAPICQTCHAQMINPLGGGFEDFDAVGLPQTQDNGQTVDASGVLYGVNSISDSNDISFNGAKELAHAIADLDVTRQCFIDTSFRMAMGTGSTFLDQVKGIELSAEEIESYTCEVGKLDDQMQAGDNSTVELLKALGTMDSVRYRKNVVR